MQLLVVTQILLGGFRPGGSAGFASEEGADDSIRRALELRKKGNDQGALPLLQDAYKKSRSARAAAQLGFCHQGLGQWAEAETYLITALDNEADPWVRKNRPVIDSSLGVVRAHVARIEVIGDPPGAEVAINGSVVGKLPLSGPVHVAAGEVEVEVQAPGYTGKTKAFRVEGGQYQRVVLRIERAASIATAVPPRSIATLAPDAVATETPAATETPDPASASAGPQPSHPGRLALKWVAWGAGALGVGVGVFGAVKNQQRAEAFGRGCGLDQGVARADTPGYTNGQCMDLKNSYESASTVAIVGFASAAVLTAAGFVLWATEPAASAQGIALHSCAPRLESGFGPGIGCVLRF